ncbi:hypothetical protein [Halorarum salinum]|uniref:Uncharacterized protein n=1 Tax=Halorarum salinum TaxID=2743089 RepID=A0A7D5LA48_9EURY|nr:hypothetical protein [Halobaculum salinum]QLG61926.1 hypothetical protein HUG12_09415 [Halobaculum salinum]
MNELTDDLTLVEKETHSDTEPSREQISDLREGARRHGLCFDLDVIDVDDRIRWTALFRPKVLPRPVQPLDLLREALPAQQAHLHVGHRRINQNHILRLHSIPCRRRPPVTVVAVIPQKRLRKESGDVFLVAHYDFWIDVVELY